MYIDLLVMRMVSDENIIKKVKELNSDREKVNYLISQGLTKEDIVKKAEDYFGVEYIDLSKTNITHDVIGNFNIEQLKSTKVIPYKYNKENKTYLIASSNLSKSREVLGVTSFLKSNGYNAEFKFSFEYEIIDKLNSVIGMESDIEEYDESIETTIVEWVDELIDFGIKNKASDIHAEIKGEYTVVRFRIDGVLTHTKRRRMTKTQADQFIVRIKMLSGMKIEEKRKPQDGRIGNYIVDGKLYDLRVSTVNTINGEKVVMRIIDKESEIISFEEIGLKEKDIEILKRNLNNPNGIIYMGGATGSGKTTTLYTMVDYRDSPDKNIYSIENPVEKEIPTINQIQIDPQAGVTYSNTLRALLRQDPDIMVIGEIRDPETADLALGASLAGHLILTTIHANNAVDILSRLYELGLKSYLISSTTLVLMSQRLLRELCPVCKKQAKLNPSEEKWVREVIEENGMDPNIINEIKAYKPVGCNQCNDGYLGRFAIAEVIEVTDELSGLIAEKASIDKFEKKAIEAGLVPFRVSALESVMEGRTSVREAMVTVN